nr:MCE family protein [Caulobacteraceae bacterium]
LVDGDGKKTMARLADAAGEMRGAAKDLRGIMAGLQGPATDFATNGLPELSGAINTMQRTLDHLDQVVGEVQANPRGLVGKPRAKEIELQP